MKKNNPTRYSSAVGEVWVMATFKIKYCHNLFDLLAVRLLCVVLFSEAFGYYGIECRKIAFDADHVHMIIDMGLYSKPELAKKLKGFGGEQIVYVYTLAEGKQVGRRILLEFRILESCL